MIYLSGDTHGDIDFQKLKTYFANRYVTSKDVLIILGDAGIVWSEEECYVHEYSFLGPTILFIDGNHENFDLLNRFPITTIFGAKAHYLYHNVYHILRGEALHINGLSFLCLGGATSIDQEYREKGISWWSEEHITKSDLHHALETAKKEEAPFDYVLTHCAPTAIVRRMFGFFGDQDSEALTELAKQVDFKHWYFGHYHKDKKWGNFRCLYNEIIEIPALNKGKRIPKQNELVAVYKGSKYLVNWKTGRKIKLTEDELPEWFFLNTEYDNYYYNLRGVKDVAFDPSPFSNHISKDSAIFLSYHGKLKKDASLRPIHEEDWDVRTWRANIRWFVLGLEKYSPNLKLDGIKARINLVYDQYLNHEANYHNDKVMIRPFPKVKTPLYVDHWSGEKAQFEVWHNNRLLASFLEKELAVHFINLYFEHNLLLNSPIVRYQNEEKTCFFDPVEPKQTVLLIHIPSSKEAKEKNECVDS